MRGAPTFVALLLLSGLVSGCLLDGTDLSAAPVEWILFENAKVWTADEAMPWASAIAVMGDRIVAVGNDTADIIERIGGEPERIDLGGRLVTPGFHDTHSHFVREAGVRDATTWETNPYEPWGPGWDPVTGTVAQNQRGAAHVQRWAQGNIDRIEDGGLPAPPSDAHGHSHEDEDAHLSMTDLGPWPLLSIEDRPQWLDTLRVALATANEYGITSSTEAGAGLDAFDVLQELDEEGALTARFNLYIFPEDLDAVIDKGMAMGAGDDDVRILGMKLYTDGWLGPRTAALRALYNDRPHQGFQFFTPDEMQDHVLRAHQAGLKITAHAIGDRAVENMLDAYAAAMEAGCPEGTDHVVCTDPRFSIEHASLAPLDLIDRMVGLGVVPSVQLSFPTSDAPWIENALGPERAAETYRWKTMLDEGLVVAGSSDWPIEVLPPLWGVQRAVTRVEIGGTEPFHAEEAVPLDVALRMITSHAAHLEHRDHELGSITEGKYADLVVLERDLFAIAPTEIAATEVAMTMVGGKVVFEDADAVTR